MREQNYSRAWTGMLTEEAGRWVRQGLISEEQQRAILALYPESESGVDRTILIFTLLGSLVVGAGVILFFAANWPILPATLKVVSIMAGVVGAYGAGYYLQYSRGTYPRVGHALIFLGALFYGAAIWLIAQIFHLESHYPNGFLLWAIGLLPVVWAVRSRPVLYLSTILLGIWTMMEQGTFESYNGLFPVLLLGGVLPLARLIRDGLVEAAVLGGLFLWFGINVTVHNEAGTYGYEAQVIARLMLLYGAALAAAGLARLGDFRPYLGVGGFFTLLGSYILTFELPNWTTGAEARLMPSLIWGSPYVMIGTGLILGGFAAAAWLYWRRAEPARELMLAAVSLPVASAALLHLLGQVPRMITFNILLFGFTLGLIALAIQRRSQLLLNIGLVAFIVHMITRYVDLFFDALDKSLFFILGGLLLLGGGWLLERNRRRWMQSWGGDGHDA